MLGERSLLAISQLDPSIHGFGIEAFFDLSYTVLQGNSGIEINKGTSPWNFFLNS